MDITYLVTDDVDGTQQVIARDEQQALDVATRYLGPGRAWRVVGTVAPQAPAVPLTYYEPTADPLEGED